MLAFCLSIGRCLVRLSRSLWPSGLAAAGQSWLLGLGSLGSSDAGGVQNSSVEFVECRSAMNSHCFVVVLFVHCFSGFGFRWLWACWLGVWDPGLSLGVPWLFGSWMLEACKTTRRNSECRVACRFPAECRFAAGPVRFSSVMVVEPSKAAGWNRWNVALLLICC